MKVLIKNFSQTSTLEVQLTRSLLDSFSKEELQELLLLNSLNNNYLAAEQIARVIEDHNEIESIIEEAYYLLK